MNLSRTTMTLLLATIFTAPVLAKPSGEGEGKGHRRPPKKALEACVGKASGTTCQFAGRQGEQVTGTCWAPKADLPLACKPSHSPHEGAEGPPEGGVHPGGGEGEPQ